jgi:hypothetical protein
MSETKELTVDDEIAALELEQRELQKKYDAEDKLAKLKVLKLVSKYTKELGRRGHEFEVVESNIGADPIVIKRPTTIDVERFTSSNEDENTVAAMNLVSAALVEPSAQVFMSRCAHTTGVLSRSLQAVLKLHDIDLGEKRGK